jgi:hypothetical protein
MKGSNTAASTDRCWSAWCARLLLQDKECAWDCAAYLPWKHVWEAAYAVRHTLHMLRTSTKHSIKCARLPMREICSFPSPLHPHYFLILHTLLLCFRQDIPFDKPFIMGGCFSKCFSGDGSDSSGNTPPRTVVTGDRYPDFSNAPVPKQQSNHQPEIAVQGDEEQGLPPYEQNGSVESLLNITRDAAALKFYGIKGAFNVLKQRHFDVYIDTAYTLHGDTLDATLFVALYLLQNAQQATNCNMTFYFPCYPNKRARISRIERSSRSMPWTSCGSLNTVQRLPGL